VTILDDLINAAERQPAVKMLVGADLVLRASDARDVPRQATSKSRSRRQEPAE
jgi:LacI family transcriptional regulator